MLRKLFVAAAAIALSVFSFGQTASVPGSTDTTPSAEKEIEKKSTTTITGSIDAYFRFNFANVKSDGKTNNFTSFTNSQNSFELGMASVKLEHTMGKVGGVIDLGFGTRAAEFSYNEAGTTVSFGDVTMNNAFSVKQAYVTYAPSDKIKFTAGTWGTHVGYELLDAYLNRNYSMSYMFSYGPFFHTGLKADISLGGKNAIMFGVANPSDLKSASFQQKMIIWQFSTASKNDKVKLYVNYQGGKATDEIKLNQVDAVVMGTISDKFSIGYNGTLQSWKAKGPNGKYGNDVKWFGSALYLNVDPQPWFGLTLRGEYFDDKDGASAGAFNSSIFSTTLSANFKIDNLTIIPEIRIDNSNNSIFTNASGAGTKSTATALVAAVYKF
jgi:hypothetical protein